ncbi:Putative membrane associated protein [Flavobacterium psychrophilum]
MTKKIFIILMYFAFTNLNAQSKGFTYQAVILNSNLQLPGVNDNKNILPNTHLDVKFNILDENGELEYQEIHKTSTDQYGMINLIVGRGIPSQNNFTDILWYGVKKELEVEIKLNASFEKLSKQELFYLPVNKFQNLIIDNDLTVGGTSNLNGDLIVNGTTTLNNSLSVTNNSPVDFSGNLVVNGTTNLNNSLSVNNQSPANLTGTLNVDGATTLNNTFTVANQSLSRLTGNLVVDGTTNLNNSLSVNNQSPANLTGTLNVDGATTLNNTFTVANQSLSNLTGNLVVDGTTNLNNSLSVNNQSPANLTGTLNVDGATTLNNKLTVTNNANTHLTGELVVDNNALFNKKVNIKDQVTIHAALPFDSDNYNNYPLRVEGSGQGIAIKLESDLPNNDNNFITFYDSKGKAIGNIEGQTAAEVASDPQYIYDISILTAELAVAGASIGLAAIPIASAGVGVVVGSDIGQIAIATADFAMVTANAAAYNAFAYSNLGVTYSSGSADYAEWLEKTNTKEVFSPGDIVGIKNGKITKNTTNAEQILAISTKPAILGNVPDENVKENFEKVAFMGQIPIKIKGESKLGNYIIASGKNDGYGYSISPENINPLHYKNIIGIAWSNVLINKYGEKFVNTSIGITTKIMSELAEKHEERITNLENRFAKLEGKLNLSENTEETNKIDKTLIDENFDRDVLKAIEKVEKEYNLKLDNPYMSIIKKNILKKK